MLSRSQLHALAARRPGRRGRAAPRNPLSVVVCTKDEAPVIERCLASVRWADEVLVLDSGSTDGTRELAARMGAVVHEHPWLGFSAQKNRAAALARNDWVLSLDADEIVSEPLAAAIARATAGAMDPRDGYVVDRRMDFLGALLPNSARRAKRRRFVRLYNRRCSGWDEAMAVHEEIRCPGRLHQLRGPLLHWNDFTVDELVALFNRYATVEARELDAAGVRAGPSHLVLRPVLRFLWHAVARGEARVGTRGVAHAGLKAAAELMRYLKLYELQQGHLPRPPEVARFERRRPEPGVRATTRAPAQSSPQSSA